MLSVVLLLLAADPKPSAMTEALKKLPAAEGVTVDPAADKEVVVDDKNGYLSVTDRKTGSQTVVALFTTATPDKVWGVRALKKGDGKPTLQVAFYRQHDGAFTDATAEVLDVKLDDVLPSGGWARPAACTQYDVELPRTGTRIVVRASRELCFPAGAGPDDADQWRVAVDKAAKKLSWDKKTATFR